MTEPSPSSPAIPPRQHIDGDPLALTIGITSTVIAVTDIIAVIWEVWLKAEGLGNGPDQFKMVALCLCIPLMVLSWRHYEDLRHQAMARYNRDKMGALMVCTDPLTGWLNRYSFAPHTDALLAQSDQAADSVAFLTIHIRDFKQFNDAKGDIIGDALLRILADRLGTLVPRGALLGRLGGNEFVCALRFPTALPDRIDHFAAAIVETLGQPVPALGLDHRIPIAIGMARSDIRNDTTRSADAASLMNMADIALYQAMKQPDGTVLWFESTAEGELRYRCAMEEALRHAIGKGEFVPYYEQQIDLASHSLRGFEMLARWHSPEFGAVAADVFIPIAEEIGLLPALSEHLIAKALRDAAAWDASLTLSVNIAPSQFRDPWFAQRLRKILADADFPASRLDVEITETCLHQNVAGVTSLAASLRSQGMSISLDDFGTGYSSLLQLAKLPFNRLKIDRSFTSAIEHDSHARTIVDTTIALGKGLGLTITVEGIENEAMLAQFTGLGKFTGQGYVFGAPMSAQETAALLASRNLLAPPTPSKAAA